MSDLLDPEILRFEASDFADWLRGGLLTYSGARKLPSKMRMPDVFPFAQLYIGRNESNIIADLKDVHQALPPPAKVPFERGIIRAWAQLEFREDYELKFAEQLLELACSVRAKGIVDMLPGALPWLVAALDETDESDTARARFRAVHSVRKRTFQAAVELASSSTESVLSIEAFVLDDSFSEPLIERNQALSMVRYLAINVPDRLPYWCAIFGNHIVADINKGMVGEKEVRDQLEHAYSVEDLQRVIDMVRIDQIGRLATERIQLSEVSMDGLFNLVSRLDSMSAGGGFPRRAVTLTWPGDIEEASTHSAELFNLLEMRA